MVLLYTRCPSGVNESFWMYYIQIVKGRRLVAFGWTMSKAHVLSAQLLTPLCMSHNSQLLFVVARLTISALPLLPIAQTLNSFRALLQMISQLFIVVAPFFSSSSSSVFQLPAPASSSFVYIRGLAGDGRAAAPLAPASGGRIHQFLELLRFCYNCNISVTIPYTGTSFHRLIIAFLSQKCNLSLWMYHIQVLFG